MRVYYKIGACSVLYSMLLIKQKVQGGENREPNQAIKVPFPCAAYYIHVVVVYQRVKESSIIMMREETHKK